MDSKHSDEFLSRLRTWVRKRVPSSADADDVVQEVLLRVVSSPRAAELESPWAWMRAVARTAVADFHRTRARGATELEPELVAAPEREDDGELVDCVRQLLGELDADDRALLERIDVGGESQAELARALGVSASGLKSRVQRARAKLREALFARCRVECDLRGLPTGPAECKPEAGDCGCAPEPGSR
ncbi:MAG: sigma-70 family RNA polymerase sigma factor [Planctomycetes bacterium]|nr:sigma-70 family RNA polymerase sigma factor [Planctomycetota bacterium]